MCVYFSNLTVPVLIAKSCWVFSTGAFFRSKLARDAIFEGKTGHVDWENRRCWCDVLNAYIAGTSANHMNWQSYSVHRSRTTSVHPTCDTSFIKRLHHSTKFRSVMTLALNNVTPNISIDDVAHSRLRSRLWSVALASSPASISNRKLDFWFESRSDGGREGPKSTEMLPKIEDINQDITQVVSGHSDCGNYWHHAPMICFWRVMQPSTTPLSSLYFSVNRKIPAPAKRYKKKQQA